jgi:hypothetical protein
VKVKLSSNNQSVVGLVVIDAGFGREDHSLIPAIAIRRGLEPLDDRTDPQTKLGGPVDRIFMVKRKKKKLSSNKNIIIFQNIKEREQS